MSDNTLTSLLILARDTVRRPQEGARRVLSLPLPPRAAWDGLALVLILSLLLTHLTNLILPAPVDPLLPLFANSPLLTAAILGGFMVAMVTAIYGVGRVMGGHGTFEGALRLTVWLQFIMLVIQVVQTGFLLVLPIVAVLIGPLAFGLMLWLLTNFIAVLHGFRSLGAVFMMIMVTAFGLGFVLFFLLALFGVTLPTEMPHV
ncbi:Yip1 family protein [Actibacterium sp. MT2.3-13A]|uniref:Yip1 family protein n=1 Tax=Actibacterium sp. MT2.3-13A TaxID=2828332 RepID=UPI001BADAF6E|nr:Yip1 family protein [Actibacterium sp. MT2.3-13A]